MLLPEQLQREGPAIAVRVMVAVSDRALVLHPGMRRLDQLVAVLVPGIRAEPVLEAGERRLGLRELRARPDRQAGHGRRATGRPAPRGSRARLTASPSTGAAMATASYYLYVVAGLLLVGAFAAHVAHTTLLALGSLRQNSCFTGEGS